MDVIAQFRQQLTAEEKVLMDSLDSPDKIQAFLDAEIPYSTEVIDRSPVRVLRDRVGHCLDGALFAAAALRLLDHPPLILQMLPSDQDDDHMVAVYKAFGCWGAIGQSNYVGLRFREPVYRSLRELVMSYFEVFFNSYGERTLLGYRRPMNMARYDHLGWMWRDEAIPVWLVDLARKPGVRVVTPEQQACFSKVDERSRQAGLLGANPSGLFEPGGYKPAYTRFPDP
jgi:hypothetical protein